MTASPLLTKILVTVPGIGAVTTSPSPLAAAGVAGGGVGAAGAGAGVSAAGVGAAAVQVGAANFANPRAMETIADEMAAWMDKNGVKTLDEIRGCARNAE